MVKWEVTFYALFIDDPIIFFFLQVCNIVEHPQRIFGIHMLHWGLKLLLCFYNHTLYFIYPIELSLISLVCILSHLNHCSFNNLSHVCSCKLNDSVVLGYPSIILVHKCTIHGFSLYNLLSPMDEIM